MKGFVPPPRLSLSNEPLPITRNITITEGISVKDLAEKLEIRAKDLIARLLAKGVFATINQNLDTELASEMARFFGAETNVISFEEQAAKEAAETFHIIGFGLTCLVYDDATGNSSRTQHPLRQLKKDKG